MDRDHFRSLLRDALTNIHDYIALEKNLLTDLIPRPNPAIRRAENLRQFIWEGIEALKPQTQPPLIDSLEWRYYLILSGRYIKGACVSEMQKQLALGERQERRLHGRAVGALEQVLWDRLFPGSETNKLTIKLNIPLMADQEPEEDGSFPVSLEPLHLGKVIDETMALFLPQLQARGGDLSVQVPANLPMVQADRIILRQILLYLSHRILQSWESDEIFISARPNSSMVILDILSLAEPSMVPSVEDLLSNKMLAYWIKRLNAKLSVQLLDEADFYFPDFEPFYPVRYELQLPMANQAKILVVDDHEPAIRIIQRYLSQTNIQAVGVSDPSQTLLLARTVKPKAVLLDVMMPVIDGWEILQKLKSDPETNKIPVIICSVWDQPDLAFSLGANGFLKKPINPTELLAELARSHLLDISDESPLRGS